MESIPFAKELTPEDEDRIIEKVSEEVVKRRMETMAIMFLESVKPLSFVGSQLAMVFVGPFLGLFGNLGVDYIMFFNKHENVEKLLKRIEEKVKIKDEEEKTAKEHSKNVSTKHKIKLQLPPGFEHLAQIGGGDQEKAIIAFGRPSSSTSERAVVAVEPLSEEPSSLSDILFDCINRESLVDAASLQGFTLRESGRVDKTKVAGHKAFLLEQTWTAQDGQSGRVESYGFWCNRTKRYFTLVLRTGPLKGDKTDKNVVKDLRSAFGGFRCH